MLGNPKHDWRANRRESARQEILEQAWSLARAEGLLGFSLRDLAKRLGMATPSLYSYFDSKHALYDAMFADGCRAFLALDRSPSPDLRTELLTSAQRYAAFSQADPVRYQLLFQRTIPGFEPSSETYALAQEAYERDFGPLRRFGLTRQQDLDLITGLVTGLVAQQLANDPTGDRWVRLIPDTVELLVDRFSSSSTPSPTRSGASR